MVCFDIVTFTLWAVEVKSSGLTRGGVPPDVPRRFTKSSSHSSRLLGHWLVSGFQSVVNALCM